MELLRLEQAVIGYRHPLLAPLTLSVQRGQRLAVLGPNGGGKSTLLRSLLGLVPLLAGRRVLATGERLRIGYVPQAHRADPVYPLSALDVVLQGRFGRIGVGGRVRAVDREAAHQQLARVGLSASAGQPFRALSGGERQRVVLARALVAEPDLLLLDEFTSELDPAASSALLAQVSALAGSGVAVVFVTHEIAAAAAHATHVALVDSHQRLFESGAAEALLTGERLSRLYGQAVAVERTGERVVVRVDASPLVARRPP